MNYAFTKAELLCSKKSIENLFAGSSRAISVYPLRAVYRPQTTQSEEKVQLLISVSKRHFRHAVDRNRIKRLIREAYRHNRELLTSQLGDKHIDMAIIWMSDRLCDYSTIESKLRTILQRIAENEHNI